MLNNIHAQFKDRIVLGSYPDYHNSYYRVKLTVESLNVSDMNDACQCIADGLPPDSLVSFDKEPIREASEKVFKMAANETLPMHEHVEHALEVIEQSLERYSLDEICVCFNGGKDCTALLHLVYAALKKKYSNENIKLKTLYISRGRSFPEIELFIKNSQELYNLELITVEGRIKDALTQLKAERPEIKAVIMGTRRTDPYSSHLESFSVTDDGWPEYMRVNPVLDWSYSDIWSFLRSLSVPYCKLYDQGYTSLGSMENTHPNPHLKQLDSKGIVSYQPAYMLKQSDSERSGRN